MIAAILEAAMHRSRVVPLLLMLFASTCAHAGGKLGVFDAWIRAAPPGATMMAGYATLKNTGDEPLTLLTVQSDAFRLTSLGCDFTVQGPPELVEHLRIMGERINRSVD